MSDFEKVDPVADLKKALASEDTAATAQKLADAQLPAHLLMFASLQRPLAQIAAQDLDNIERAAILLKTKGIGIPWQSVWSGLEGKIGWSIVRGTEEVAFTKDIVGGPLKTLVNSIVQAHNTALGLVE